MQVMLEATVVAQTLHLEQVTNSSFRNHFGSFFGLFVNCIWWYVNPSLWGYRQQRFESLDQRTC